MRRQPIVTLLPTCRPLPPALVASLSTLLPSPVQLKSATDTATTAASNLDKNYGAHASSARAALHTLNRALTHPHMQMPHAHASSEPLY